MLEESRIKMNTPLELTKIEMKRSKLHDYIILKLDERDYHAIADAAMDLRELEARSKVLNDYLSENN